MKQLVRLILFLFLSLLLVNCTANQANQPTTATNPPVTSTPGPIPFKIATANSAGSWYSIGRTIANQIAENNPKLKVSAIPSNNVMENLKLLASDKASLVFGYDYHVRLANQGRLMSVFPDAKPEKINIKCGVEITRMPFPDYSQPMRIVLPLYELPIQIVTTAGSGISSLADMKGKRISTGEPGSISTELAGYIFNSFGLSMERDITRTQTGLRDSIGALNEGSIDAFIWSGEAPTPEIAELATKDGVQIVLVPIAGEDATRIMAANPGIFHPANLPSGSYTGVTKDIGSLAISVVLISMEDTKAEIINSVVKSFFENRAEFTATWPGAANLSPEYSLALLDAEGLALLHTGSKHFFEDNGLLK